MATIDYMICAYGPYSASATGGNVWSRDFLAGVLTLPAVPFYSNIGDRPLQYASAILACIATLLVLAVYVIYWKGPVLRKRSPFAQELSNARVDQEGGSRRVSMIPGVYGSRRHSFATPNSRRGSLALPGSRPGSVSTGSRMHSYIGPAQESARERAAKANRDIADEEKAQYI
jgi:hypothetical protein